MDNLPKNATRFINPIIRGGVYNPQKKLLEEIYFFKPPQDEIENGLELFKCHDECGNCTKMYHDSYDVHWYGSRYSSNPTEQPTHYAQDQDQNWIVQHSKKYFIVECTQKCICAQTGYECKNSAVSNLLDNPHPFVIFKSADARGWGLKCLTEIKKGAPVIEVLAL